MKERPDSLVAVPDRRSFLTRFAAVVAVIAAAITDRRASRGPEEHDLRDADLHGPHDLAG